jgi:hypothetical protein
MKAVILLKRTCMARKEVIMSQKRVLAGSLFSKQQKMLSAGLWNAIIT